MTTAIRRRRGTTAQHSTFIGLDGEITVDTTKETVVVHDGTTQGGFPLQRENGSQNLVTTGTATAASFIPTSSTAPTNGVYLPAANSVAISTGGSGRLFVDSNGRVGIGQNFGLRKLTVTGESNGADGAYATGQGSIVLNEMGRSAIATEAGGIEFKASTFGNGYGTKILGLDDGGLVIGTRANSATWSERLRITSTGALNFTGAGTAGVTQAVSFNGSAPVNSLVVDSSGRVGVGTSSPSVRCQIDDVANSAPVTLLRVNNTGTTSGGAGLASRITFTGGATNLGFIQGSNYASGKGGIQLSGDGTNVHVTLDGATGALGIGSSAPQAELNVAKTGGAATVYIESDASNNATTSILRLGGASGRSASIQGFRGASSNIHSLDFYTYNSGDSFGMRLTPTGLGIGTTSPGVPLDVVADSGAIAYRVRGRNSDNVGDIQFTDNGATTAYVNLRAPAANTFTILTGGSERARIDSSGRLLVGTSSQSGGALLQVNGDRVRIATAKTPASATDTGTAGEICWDASYVYVCTATNTWKRSALSTW